MLTFSLVLVLLALICTIAHAMGKLPIWIAVLLLVLVELLNRLPVR